MASLGFALQERPARMKTKTVKVSEITASIEEVDIFDAPTEFYESSWPRNLLIFNIALVFAHLGVLLYITVTDFRFPMTFFYTTLKDSVLQDFRCIYDYGSIFFNTSSTFCSDISLTITGNSTPPQVCETILSGENSLPAVSSSGGPLISAYELTRFGQDNNSVERIDDIGRFVTKGILITIESCTTIAHILYSVFFARMFFEFKSKKSDLANWFLSNGGLPLRWIEYAVTAALMSLFIANTANLFEFFGVLGLTMSTFSLMFFGMLAEKLISEGKSDESLFIIYIPALSIFIATWAPIIQSLATSVFKISCQTYETDTFLSCSSQTCFGKEVPIPIFSSVLFLLFCIFPIVLIYKIYVIGGWFSYIDDYLTNVLKIITCQPFKNIRIICFPLFKIIQSLTRFFNFIVFIFLGGFIAWFQFFKKFFSVLLPIRVLKERKTYSKVSLNTLFLCEFLYAVASATSKIFLAVFFTISFADRDW